MVLALVHQGCDQQFAAVENAFDLELHEFIAAFAERLGGGETLGLDQGVDLPAQRSVGHADEPPRLHQTDAGSGMSGLQQPQEHHRVDGPREKVTHVTPLRDGAIDGRPLGLAECMFVHD